MALAKILGQDTVSGGSTNWWETYGQHGYHFLDSSGNEVYQQPSYLTDLDIYILGNGNDPLVDGVKNPGGLSMPTGGTTQRSLADGSFSDTTALGIGVAITPSDNDPHLLSIYTYRRDGGVSLKFTLWDAADTVAITPTWSVATPLSGYGSVGYWMRVAYSGAVLLKIEKVSGSSSIPLTCLAFGAYANNHAGSTQGFVGHSVF